MNVFEPLLIYVGVDLCGGNVGVAQHHLYGTKVCSVAEQVGGKGVSQHMWRNFLIYTSCKRRLFYNLPEPEPGHAGSAISNEEVVAALILENKRSGCLHVGFDLFFCLLTKRDEALFVPLTYNSDKPCTHVAGRKR